MLVAEGAANATIGVVAGCEPRVSDDEEGSSKEGEGSEAGGEDEAGGEEDEAGGEEDEAGGEEGEAGDEEGMGEAGVAMLLEGPGARPPVREAAAATGLLEADTEGRTGVPLPAEGRDTGVLVLTDWFVDAGVFIAGLPSIGGEGRGGDDVVTSEGAGGGGADCGGGNNKAGEGDAKGGGGRGVCQSSKSGVTMRLSYALVCC
ncbi:hypothetical protein WJX79_010497 [Trebouxia sp. C0005]